MTSDHTPGRSTRARAAGVLIAAHLVGLAWATIGWIAGRLPPGQIALIDTIFDLTNLPVARTLASVLVMTVVTTTLLRRRGAGLWMFAISQVMGGAASLFFLGWLCSPDGAWAWRDPWAWVSLVPLVTAIGGLCLAWWLRPEFPARLRRSSWVGLAATLLVGAAGVTALAAGVMWYADGRLPTLGQLAAFTWHAIGMSDDGWGVDPVRLSPLVMTEIVGFAAAVVVAVAIWLFLRTASIVGEWTPEREMRIRALVRDHGDADSLSYLATRRDRAAVFSPDGKAAISYGVRYGVALAAGDPLGEPSSWPAAIEAWQRVVRSYGWHPALLSVSKEGARAYARAGFEIAPMGDEAILETSRFTLTAPALQPVRKAVNHVRKEGVVVDVQRLRQLSAEEVLEVRRCAEAWRHGKERGFSMALDRPLAAEDGETVVVRALRDDALVALLTFVPWGQRGCSLNLMRRSPQAPHGVTEAMVAGLMASAPTLGITRASLNFCMFRKSFESEEDFAVSGPRGWNVRLLTWLDRFWQLKRLYQSNRRYLPTWQSRYLGWADDASLPWVLLAAGTVEGFVPQIEPVQPTRELTPEQVAEALEVSRRPALSAQELMPRISAASAARRARLVALEAEGLGGYPAAEQGPTHRLSALWALEPGSEVTVAGRIRRVRSHGAVTFVDLDGDETIVQLIVDEHCLTGDARHFDGLVDVGDVVLIDGVWSSSRTRTPSVQVTRWQVTAKCLHPVPWTGWTDVEARARRRELDLLVHADARQHLQARSLVLSSIRRTLESEGYMEVETPVLHPLHGGASARPFVTHINAYDRDLYLRIAPEPYLKRLIVGGMGPIFELSRNFRNEGVDATHNPEFTSLEAYRPYCDYHHMRLLTQRLVRAAAVAAHGREEIVVGGRRIGLSAEWRVVPVLDAVSQAVGREVSLEEPRESLVALAHEYGLTIPESAGPGAIIEEIYGEIVEPATQEPTFYVDFPAETSPLTRPHRTKPGLVERWDLVVNGMELGTAYTELTDPVDQRLRFTEQSLKAAAGDLEAMQVDEPFLRALETGMPPTGGLGIGIDRLVMLMTGQPIRGVLTFPFASPEPRGRR